MHMFTWKFWCILTPEQAHEQKCNYKQHLFTTLYDVMDM